jgi:hypothetical protein
VTDLLFIAIVVAFFAISVAYVRLCDRIIGPDPAARESFEERAPSVLEEVGR